MTIQLYSYGDEDISDNENNEIKLYVKPHYDYYLND